MKLLDQIKAQARQKKRRIVLPESHDERILRAAEALQREKLCEVILVGERGVVGTKARKYGLELAGVDVVSMQTHAAAFRDIYTHKSEATPDSIAQWLQNPLFYGAMLADQGMADGMVAGSLAPTADVLRAAIKVIGLQPAKHLISSIFLMVAPQESRILTYADCAVVPNPTSAQLADIAITSAKTHALLTGQSPQVALLSFSTKGSAKHADVDKVVEAVTLIRAEAPDLQVDGELQADAALISEIGQKKAPGSPVAGTANVLIFPDLDAGNIAYKITERLAQYQAIGPILQGLNKPVNDLSRGCSVEDVINVACITSILTG